MTIEDEAILSLEIDALSKMTVTDNHSGEVLSLRQYVRRLSDEPLAAEIKALETIVMINDRTGERLPFRDYIQSQPGEYNFIGMDETFNGQHLLKVKRRVLTLKEWISLNGNKKD